MAGAFRWNLENSILALARVGRKGAMDEPDKPNLGLFAYEEIEAALHEIDKTFWQALSEMLQPISGVIEFVTRMSGKGPLPPKRPQKLCTTLYVYAQELFRKEASQYPQSPQLQHWLSKLAERIGERVMQTVYQLENNNRLQTLTYHGVSHDKMKETVDEALKSILASRSQHPQQQSTCPEAQFTPKPIESERNKDDLPTQLASLMNECHLTAEQVAVSLGVTPRSVFRHLSGEAKPRKNHLIAYEELFSKKLKREVRLNTSSKRHPRS